MHIDVKNFEIEIFLFFNRFLMDFFFFWMKNCQKKDCFPVVFSLTCLPFTTKTSWKWIVSHGYDIYIIRYMEYMTKMECYHLFIDLSFHMSLSYMNICKFYYFLLNAIMYVIYEYMQVIGSLGIHYDILLVQYYIQIVY